MKKSKIKLINESEDIELYDKYKDYIYDNVLYCVDNFFDFKVNLEVIIKKLDDEKDVAVEPDATFTKNRNKYVVVINTDVLKSIKYDGGKRISAAIYHELAHLYDVHNLKNNKYFKMNPYIEPRTYDSAIFNERWHLWTEHYAYYMTYRNFLDGTSTTPYKLFKKYEKLEKEYKKLKELNCKGLLKDNYELCENFFMSVNNFIYCVAQFTAYFVIIKKCVNNYNYCEKTYNNPSFIKVENIIDGVLRKISKLYKNTYGKGLYNKIMTLGNYLFEHVYTQFGIYVLKENGCWKKALYLDE